MNERDAIIGVYVYGALGLAGLMLLAFMQGNLWAMALAVAACGFSWLAQNLFANGVSGSLATYGGLALAVASLVVAMW